MHNLQMTQSRDWRPTSFALLAFAACAAFLTPVIALPLPIYRTALACMMTAGVLAMLLASAWLAAQAHADKKPARMLLALGFLFTASSFVPYGLLVPNLFPHVALAAQAADRASATLSAMWHGAFLAGTAAFLLFNARFPNGASAAVGRRWVRTFGLGGLALWLAALPVALRWSAPRGILYPLLVAFALLTLLAHVRLRRPACMLDRFLGIVCAAMLLDLYLGHTGGAVYTVGWYVARFDAALVAAGTLVVLIVESLVIGARLNVTMRRLSVEANHDALTGLPNRRFFESEGERAIEAARHHHLPTAVGLVDIDRFKSYNDVFGHAAGDSTLQRVATLIAQCLWRPGDFVARLGGEEFVLVLPATDTIGAYFVMERIREVLAQESLPAPSGELLTVSIGVAELRSGDSLSGALARADSALYAAKNGGRDRIELRDLPEFELSFARRAK